MVAAVRKGRSLRAVARPFGVGVATVASWVQRAQGQRLDRVDWSDRPSAPHRNAAGDPYPVNAFGVSQKVKIFRCPSDSDVTTDPRYAPTNYTGCLGSGANGGTRVGSDGVFYQNSGTRIADISDGTSNTALVSEHPLGTGGPSITDPSLVDVRIHYGRFPANVPVTDAICSGIQLWPTDRGARWADGEAPYAEYDHHYPPNAPQWDCVALEHSWKPARSRHTGGVNLLLADSSVRFVADGVNIATWQALGSRAGTEVVGDY
jgi:prepilin-type processing-associated H-X9-DG protein